MSIPGVHRLPGVSSDAPMIKSELMILLHGMISVATKETAVSQRLRRMLYGLMQGDTTVPNVLKELGWDRSVPYEEQ